jgi:hypothetical protein
MEQITYRDGEDTRQIQFITTNWFMQICQFLIDTNAKIVGKPQWKPIKKREIDIIIMDEVVLLNCSPMYKRVFNNWIMYYQINTLSDITNCTGDRIEEVYLNKRMAVSCTQTKSETNDRYKRFCTLISLN